MDYGNLSLSELFAEADEFDRYLTADEIADRDEAIELVTTEVEAIIASDPTFTAIADELFS